MRMSGRSLTFEHVFARRVQTNPTLLTWIGPLYFTVNTRFDLAITLEHQMGGYYVEITDGTYTTTFPQVSGILTREITGINGLLNGLIDFLEGGGFEAEKQNSEQVDAAQKAQSKAWRALMDQRR